VNKRRLQQLQHALFSSITDNNTLNIITVINIFAIVKTFI